MRVLPITTGVQYRQKTNTFKTKPNMGAQTPMTCAQKSQSNPSFKQGKMLPAAAIFGTIYGGAAALLFAAPAVIAGAIIFGLASGAAFAEGN